jgi:hypothetical protein
LFDYVLTRLARLFSTRYVLAFALVPEDSLVRRFSPGGAKNDAQKEEKERSAEG